MGFLNPKVAAAAQSHTNSIYGIKIQHPSNWSLQKGNSFRNDKS
jgi:hypothetical protein